jgi:26S proteasome regulatory subunit T4
MSGSSDQERGHALEGYKSKLLESREWEAKLKALRLDIKALQSVGQIIGEVLKQLDEERCTSASHISVYVRADPP